MDDGILSHYTLFGVLLGPPIIIGTLHGGDWKITVTIVVICIAAIVALFPLRTAAPAHA